ncbi:MAG TPA: LytTR family DNA-binding domain-containing protein [Burkholderiaceae bacterium]
MPTAIIADDEDLALGELRAMLKQAWPELEVIAACDNGTDALEAIMRRQPDVAFLDIRMPGLTGLDVAQAAAGKCQVVFTTAYDAHAIKAFDLGALDYLLKPLTKARLDQAIERLQDRLRARLASQDGAPDWARVVSELDRRLAQARQNERLRWISASVGDTIHLYSIEEVVYFESDLKYTRVVTEKDEALVRLTLKEIQNGLDPDQFWQVHRATIVRASAISCARRDEAGGITLELRNRDEKIKVSRAYAWRFKGM